METRVDGMILRRILEKYGVKLWNGFIWIRVRSTGGILYTW